jgi:16S rRNA (cytidine1402-2'-O)-methyltransferase
MPKLYLIPTPLGEDVLHTSPEYVLVQTRLLTHFVVERAKTARQWLKKIGMPVPIEALHIEELNIQTPPESLQALLRPALELGVDIGLMSEAGCPAVADPGAQLVRLAHEKGIEVVPFVGASSILLALMGSGMQGQSFAFVGYLPVEVAQRRRQLLQLEKQSQSANQTQLFIETPYRNDAMLETCLSALANNTLLGVAADLTLPTQFIQTKTVGAWKKSTLPNLHRRPAIFMIYAGR